MIINNLSKLMKDRRFTLKQLSKTTGLDYTNLWRIYHNKTSMIQFQVLDKICFALEVQTNEILEFKNDEPPPPESKQWKNKKIKVWRNKDVI